MSWVRIDDAFDDHPKILKLSPFAVTLHVRALCWCSRHMTDGFVPEEAIERLTFGLTLNDADENTLWPEAAASIEDELRRAELWEKCAGGWSIHDYLKYNPSRKSILSQRRIKSDAGRQGGIRSGKSRRSSCLLSASSKHEAAVWPSASEESNSRPLPGPSPKDLTTSPPTPPQGASTPQSKVHELEIQPKTPQDRAGNHPTDPPGFSEVWNLYPKHRRTGKLRARQYWKSQKLEPKLDIVRAGLETHLKSKDWVKEEGKYVPAFNKFLREGRWEDEPVGQDPDPYDF